MQLAYNYPLGTIDDEFTTTEACQLEPDPDTVALLPRSVMEGDTTLSL